MLSGIKQQGVVGKNGKIEIHTSELAEGTVVEVIILAQSQDETEYLMSTEANRKHLLEALQSVEHEQDLVTFTAKEWDEEYNVHS